MNDIDYNSKIDIYTNRVNKYSKLILTYHKMSTYLSYMRLGIIVFMIIGFYSLLDAAIYLVIAWLMFSVIMFIYVVIRHRRSERFKHKAQILYEINQNELDLIAGKPNRYDDGVRFVDNDHPYANDLDVVGPYSLYHSLNRTKTFRGGRYLSKYLLQPSTIGITQSRTQATRELEPLIEFRQELAYRLYEVGDQHADPVEDINRLLEQYNSFAIHPGLRVYYKALPLIWIGLIMGYMVYPLAIQNIAGLLAGINFMVAIYYAKTANSVQNNVSRALRDLRSISSALEHIFSLDYKSSYIKGSIDRLRSDKSGYRIKSLQQLQSIIDFLDYRLNLIVGTMLNVLFLWDLRILTMLMRWKEHHGHSIDQIFDVLAKIEAVSSMATWAYNNDQFEYAHIQSGDFYLQAIDIHHPLLISGPSVANSLTITTRQHITIVTGSNMAGKSTFLRTIGSNMILAYAGTRITGQSLKLSLVRLLTYMRIKDSLEENVSTFKAELNRVSLIFTELKQEQDCLVLIDEMLRGTNSVDKLTGSIAITQKLLKTQTHAMIATHDIQLAELQNDRPESIQNYYFDISLTDGELEFDYKLKQGICDTFNASYLLRALDLDVPTHERSLSTK